MPTLRDLRSTSTTSMLQLSFVTFSLRPLHSILCFCLFLFALPTLKAQKWIDPTPAELAQTSLPEVPGAAAYYLEKDESTDDDMHTFSYYVRLKVLTDRGKDYANVELRYYIGESSTTIDSIEGRTIHPDGTIIPFAGKPYDKFIARASGYKEKAKIFTLPAVDIGSIIEYRYKLRLDDNRFRSPDWYIQSDLFVRKAHYIWHPTDKDLVDEDGKLASGSIAWTPILPRGAEVKVTKTVTGRDIFNLDIADVPPIPTAESMPPLQSVSYRVLFFYTPYRSQDEFWSKTGKSWSKKVDKFIGNNSAVRDYANSLVSPTDTQDQKARKLYAAIMAIENTDFTRSRTSSEEKAQGLGETKTAEDVIARKRGNSDQLTLTFVALARAVGLKAYVMGVANRNERIFIPSYLSLYQIDDDIAILNIDAKDIYLDPGQRYCAYGHLSWIHALTAGIRQTDSGTAIGNSPAEPYANSHTIRIADLKLDEHGEAAGTVTISYQGDPALHWRQEFLRGDEASLKDDLKTNLESLLPGGLDIRVLSILDLTQYDQPLKVSYFVKGPIGSPAGKRLLITADLFLSQEKPKFTEAKREIPIDLHYAFFTQDAVRITLPPSLAIESAPEPAKELMKNLALFSFAVKRTPTSITTQRNVQLGTALFFANEYPDLHTFYAKLASKDQETLILTRTATSSAPGAP